MYISFKKDQRGIAAVTVAIAIVLVAGVGFVGWRMTQKSSTLRNATPAQQSIIDKCNKLYSDTDLCNFAAFSEIEKLSYKMDVNSTDAEGKTSKLVVSSDGKGNTAVKSIDGDQAYDVILLNDVSYMRDSSDGQWWKFGATSGVPKQSDFNKDFKLHDTFVGEQKDNYSYKKLGKEKCGKLNCFKYQLTDKSQPGATQYVWFDDKDYRMQRFYSKDKGAITELAVTYQKVTITEPSPVKEFNAGGTVDNEALQQQIQDSLNESGAVNN